MSDYYFQCHSCGNDELLIIEGTEDGILKYVCDATHCGEWGSQDIDFEVGYNTTVGGV